MEPSALGTGISRMSPTPEQEAERAGQTLLQIRQEVILHMEKELQKAKVALENLPDNLLRLTRAELRDMDIWV